MAKTTFNRSPNAGAPHPTLNNKDIVNSRGTNKTNTTQVIVKAPRESSPVSITATAPLQMSGNAISMPQASTAGSGYLTFADWMMFNAKMTNPMTAAGDIIYGGMGGVPTRLPVGTDGDVYTVVSGVPAWAASSGGGSTFAGIAGEAIAINDYTYVELDGALGTAGYLYKADSGNIHRAAQAFLSGIALTSAAASGDPLTVQWGGKVSGFSGLTSGALYYIDAAGAISTSNASGALVGVALSSTELFINTRGLQSPAPTPYQTFPHTNLILYLDSSLGVTMSGSNVASWADQSTLGNDFNSNLNNVTVSSSMFGSLPGIFFNGSSDLKSVTYAGWGSMTQCSMYVVMQWVAQTAPANGAIIGHRSTAGGGAGSSSYSLYLNNTPGFLIWDGSTAATQALTITSGQNSILSCIGDLSNIAMYQDGAFLGNQGHGIGTNVDNYITIGDCDDGLNERGTGYIGAILIYDTKLNSTDDAAVIAYLKSRFGIP